MTRFYAIIVEVNMNSPESKFIALARHGELANPKNIVYSRDAYMKPEDIIHISDAGIIQMHELGKALINKGMKVVRIYTSPETRAIESSAELARSLGDVEIVVNGDLDDVFSPGPYKEKMTMDQLVAVGGNVYEGEKWEKYNHEKP